MIIAWNTRNILTEQRKGISVRKRAAPSFLEKEFQSFRGPTPQRNNLNLYQQTHDHDPVKRNCFVSICLSRNIVPINNVRWSICFLSCLSSYHSP